MVLYKLDAPWTLWVLNYFKPSIYPWGSGWVQRMKSPSGRVEGGRNVRSGYLFSQSPAYNEHIGDHLVFASYLIYEKPELRGNVIYQRKILKDFYQSSPQIESG